MLLLLFYLRKEIYGIDSSQVVEIIPRVNLRQLYQVPQYVAGLFNYREKFVPVVDLCHLIQETPCSPSLSTRIIIVKYPMTANRSQYLGLMAEKVTDTLQRSDLTPSWSQPTPFEGEVTATWEDSSPTLSSSTTWGKLIVEEQGSIQLLRVESLLPERERNWLLITAGQESRSNWEN